MDGVEHKCEGYGQNESDQCSELDPLFSVHLHLQRRMHFACHRNRSPSFAFIRNRRRIEG